MYSKKPLLLLKRFLLPFLEAAVLVLCIVSSFREEDLYRFRNIAPVGPDGELLCPCCGKEYDSKSLP